MTNPQKSGIITTVETLNLRGENLMDAGSNSTGIKPRGILRKAAAVRFSLIKH